MIATFKQLIRDESGATAIEYGLIAALVSVAAIGALTTMGESLTTIFGVVSTNLSDAATAASTPTE
ncbi:MAG TPA: Flp family type IVb pilin [Alphaproteobacteria bacterium]|jgi:pilus assembly protein Flp/PilA